MLSHDTVNKEYFVDAIVDGDADSFLDAISGAIKMRRESLNERKMLFINAGDVVRFNKTTRPKYLAGLEAEVVRVNKKRIVVKFINEDSKRRARKFGIGEFTTPISLVEKIS